MVPRRYFFLTKKPVNKNGKLDRASIKKIWSNKLDANTLHNRSQSIKKIYPIEK